MSLVLAVPAAFAVLFVVAVAFAYRAELRRRSGWGALARTRGWRDDAGDATGAGTALRGTVDRTLSTVHRGVPVAVLSVRGVLDSGRESYDVDVVEPVGVARLPGLRAAPAVPGARSWLAGDLLVVQPVRRLRRVQTTPRAEEAERVMAALTAAVDAVL